MATKAQASRSSKGRAQLSLQVDRATLEVQLDRDGFRRLLQTLQQLAETGDPQLFERSGRRRMTKGAADSDVVAVKTLIFSIDRLRNKEP